MYKLIPVPLFIFFIISTTTAFSAPERNTNLLTNSSFENSNSDGSVISWNLTGPGTSIVPDAGRDGGAALKCQSRTRNRHNGAMQEIVFDTPLLHPFQVSGWSKAKDIDGADYCLYMDIWYEDGTNLWGQQKPFTQGTHDWEQVKFIFSVDKPVVRIQYFILLRNARGTAWFDDVKLELAPLNLTHERILPGLYGGNNIDYFARYSLPVSWTAEILQKGKPVYFTSGKVNDAVSFTWDGHDTTGKLLEAGKYTIRVNVTESYLGETMSRTVTVNTPRAKPRNLAVWTENSMKRIFTHSVPEEISTKPVNATVKLARNEYESFQIALRTAPEVTLTDARVDISDLTGPKGAVITAENIQWHQVGFVKFNEINVHPFEPEAQPGWWPDPLLPVSKFSVLPATTQSLWVTVYAPRDAKPGTYKGTVTITAEDIEPVTVSVNVTVYNFDMPDQPHIKTAFALMDSYLENLYGGAPAELRQQYGDFVLTKRLNPDDISRTTPPAFEDLEHFYNNGLNAFNVINMVRPRQFGQWVCWSEKEFYTPEFKQYLIDVLDPYVAEMKKRGFADKAYVYTYDERGEDFWPIMTEFFGLIKERYDLPTFTTAYIPQEPEIMKKLNLDWNCPLTPVYDYEKAEKCRAEGLQVWAYVCCGPGYPYANWLADFPLIESRILWWQAYQQKMDGILYWGLNIWHRENNNYLIDPEKDGPYLKWSITTGGEETWLKRLHGDGDLLYAGKDGPIGCTRLDNIRDGIEDYEYLWLLSELKGTVKAGQDACEPVTTSTSSFTRDPQVIENERDRIAREIEKLITRKTK